MFCPLLSVIKCSLSIYGMNTTGLEVKEGLQCSHGALRFLPTVSSPWGLALGTGTREEVAGESRAPSEPQTLFARSGCWMLRRGHSDPMWPGLRTAPSPALRWGPHVTQVIELPFSLNPDGQ